MDLLIIATNRDAAQSLKEDMDAVLYRLINIETYQFTEDSYAQLGFLLKERPRLILSTRQFIVDYIRREYPEFEVMLARRDLFAPQQLHRLFQIPEGSRVSVVNETREGSLETIAALKQLGVTHLKYVPYWEGCDTDISGCRYAVSPGMSEYYADGTAELIDIGMRRLSAATYMKILTIFHLDQRYLDLYVLHSRGVLTDAYKKLGASLTRSRSLEQSLHKVLDQLDFALLVFRHDGTITKYNAYAGKIFAALFSSQNPVTVNDCVALFREENTPTDPATLDGVFSLDGQQYYVDCILMEEESEEKGILRLRDIADFQRKETVVRQETYRKMSGYTAHYHFEELIAESPAMEDIIRKGRRFAMSDASILITGESGTGKELFAQSIHNASARKDKPFVAVNFAALPENLVESELFGYEEGAFTGAKKSGKKGIFELAHEGTVFLDEIGDASPWVQMRLLRVLEEKEVMRLGDTKVIPVDVRVIAATNKDVKLLMAEDKFREDLYYRLNTLQVQIPPLRQRKEAVLPLFHHLLEQKGMKKELSEGAARILMTCSWKGNVRELRNVAEYVFIMSQGRQIQKEDLPEYLLESDEAKGCCETEDTDYMEVISEKEENDVSIAAAAAHLTSIYPEEELAQLLELLHRFPGSQAPSRRALAEAMAGSHTLHTESQIRKVLSVLRELNLISVGKTRQGTRLTEKGEAFYRYIMEVFSV